MELQMTAPCLLGLEGLVAEELRQMDAREVTAENGRVFFNGDQAMLARANINSRFAERILIVLDRFTAVRSCSRRYGDCPGASLSAVQTHSL